MITTNSECKCTILIGHFRVAPSLCFKAKWFGWKWFVILMQAKLIIEKRSLNLASLAWKVRAFGTRKFPVYEAHRDICWLKMPRKDWLNSGFNVYYIDTDEKPGCFLLVKNHIFISFCYRIFLFFIRILTFWNRKYNYYCLYFSLITLYLNFITFLW